MDVSRRTSGVMDLDTFRRATDMLESDSASRMSMDIYDIYDEMLGSRTNSPGGGRNISNHSLMMIAGGSRNNSLEGSRSNSNHGNSNHNLFQHQHLIQQFLQEEEEEERREGPVVAAAAAHVNVRGSKGSNQIDSLSYSASLLVYLC